jgi:outer membrane protein assembly factor BamB
MKRAMKAVAMTLAIALAGALTGGCSLFDTKEKMAKLTPIPKPVAVNRLWADSIGNAWAVTRWWQFSVGSTPPPSDLTPAIADGSVFVASQNGAITRYDGATGKQLWRIQAGQTITGGVGADGLLVVVGTPKGGVIAFDGQGKKLWTAQVTSEVLSPPAIVGGVVVVRTSDNRIFGLDAADGKKRWTVLRAAPALVARSSAGVAVADGTIYAGFAGGKLLAITASNGATKWEATVSTPRGTTELERISDVTSVPEVLDGLVCAVAFQGKLSCFEAASGNPMWSHDVSSAAGLGLDIRYVYVADDKGLVQAFDRATGASAWKQDRLSLRQLTAPVSQGRFVAVGDVEGYIHFLNREDGSFAGRIATDGSPVVTGMKIADQVLIAQTRKGGLFAVTAQ